MSFIGEAVTHPVPILSSLELQKVPGKEHVAAVGSENERTAEQPLKNVIGDGDSDVVLVDFAENDPANPLNWSSMHKWLIVFVVSWMGFVRWASPSCLAVSVYLSSSTN
jgi:hypothetical protein